MALLLACEKTCLSTYLFIVIVIDILFHLLLSPPPLPAPFSHRHSYPTPTPINIFFVCKLMFIMYFHMFVVAAYDPAYYKDKKAQLVKATFMIVYCLVKDERCQVNGMKFLSDFTGLTVAHQMFFTMDDMRRQMKYWQVRKSMK